MGALFVFPTDTVYGVGARATDVEAVRVLRQLKARPHPQPFTLHLGNINDLKPFCMPLTKNQKAWLCALLPGPHTVLLNASRQAPPDAVLDGKVGLRVPGGTSFKLVFDALGPILGTSANRQGKEPLNDPEAILTEFKHDLHSVIVADEKPSGRSSSILDLTLDWPRALRGTLPNNLQSTRGNDE